MKKTQFALAALALVASSAALANGVTVYGNVDVALTNGDNGTFLGTAGNYQQSRIGFSGSEDLGGGLKADFNLESGIGNNGGIGGGGVGSSFFNRAANVGISNNQFSVHAGTKLSTFILSQIAGATGVGGDASLVPGLYIVNGGNVGQVQAGGLPNGGFFVANALTASMNFAGFTASAQTRATGTAGDKYMAVSLSGSLGGVNFSVAHQDTTNLLVSPYSNSNPNVDGPFNVRQKNTSIAANTEIGMVRINGIWSSNQTNWDGWDSKQGNTGYLIGASMPLANKLSGGLTYARNNDKAAYGNVEYTVYETSLNGTDNYMASTMISATLKYDLSKTSWIYGTYSTFNTETGIPDNAGSAGFTKKIATVGLVKAF